MAAVDLVKSGAKLKEIAEQQPLTFARYHRGIERLKQVLTEPRDGGVEPKILIYWGASGTGKTFSALEEFPDAYVVIRPNKDGQVWWDNYDGESVIIFDEFYGWFPYDMLLRLCDRSPFQGAVKGGFTHIKATTFVFTSNKPWEEWYSVELREKTNDFEAFRRRLREWGQVKHFKALKPRDDGEAVVAGAKRQRLLARIAPEGGETTIGFA